MERHYYLSRIEALSNQFPAVALFGPRQVGKTTLAMTYAKNQCKPIHLFDLENPEDVEILTNPRVALESLEGLVIIDEIQKKPDLFPLLRVLIDHPKQNQKWLILGSASKELLHQSSESLAGRLAYLEIQPFSFEETKVTQKLWLRGGFPKSYLTQSDSDSFEWRKQYVKTFLEQDIPNLGIRISP